MPGSSVCSPWGYFPLPGASCATEVLPALLVLGLGMVTLVAPLTATVLASVDTARAGLASGINNAAARAAGRVAVAAPAPLAGIGSAIAFTTVRRPAPGRSRPECRTHGGVAVPPLEAGGEAG